MFGKIFKQIFDSSIAEDLFLRIVFQDFIILADIDGVVDMTPEAISRRTNVPLDTLQQCITRLEAPDPKSRSKDFDGARIVRLDNHRAWGWRVVNYYKYRGIRCESDRKAYKRNWIAQNRSAEKSKKSEPVDKSRHKGDPSASTSTSSSNGNGSVREGDIAETFLPEASDDALEDFGGLNKFCDRLRSLYGRKENQPWPNDEEHLIALICRRQDYLSELDLVCGYDVQNHKYFPKSVRRLLETWDSVLDGARRFKTYEETIPESQRVEILKNIIGTHPANDTSQAYRQNCTQEQRDHLKRARAQLKSLQKQREERVMDGH